MQNERLHPLLLQTPLSVNRFIDLPKAPTLPHNYASLPSTLPPSTINASPAQNDPDLPAYVISPSGSAAHPRTIINQNNALLKQLSSRRQAATERVTTWEQSIAERELQEKRRRAPGWLDSDHKLLEPERAVKKDVPNVMDEPSPALMENSEERVEDLGAAMDRAFGRSEMG